MQQHVFEHFYSEDNNRFLRNVCISLIDKTDGFQPKKKKTYSMRTLKTLVSLGLIVKSCYLTFYILDRCFCKTILDWTVFRLRTLDTIVISYLFFLSITPLITMSTSFGSYSIDQKCKLIDDTLHDLDVFIASWLYPLLKLQRSPENSLFFVHLFLIKI